MEGPVRVALVLNRMDSGGIEAVVMNYCRRIDSGRVAFTLFVCRDSLLPQREELEKLGIPVCLIPPYTHVGEYQRTLLREFREGRFDIVHAHLNTMSVFPLFAAWRAGIPVRICHNHTTAHWGEGKKTFLKYLLRPFNKIFATHYFACSRFAGEWMFGKSTFEKGRVRVMTNAIDAEVFSYDPAARERLRRELKIPADAKVVGHVGRLTYQKNQEFLFRLTAELERRGIRAFLLLVGGGEMEGELREKVRAMGLEAQVIFAGVREDVAKTYSAMDLFYLPSYYEGFGLVALEAQASGLPCICSMQVPGEVLENETSCRVPIEGDTAPARWADLAERYLKLSRTAGTGLDPQYSIAAAAGEMQRWYEQTAGKK